MKRCCTTARFEFSRDEQQTVKLTVWIAFDSKTENDLALDLLRARFECMIFVHIPNTNSHM